MVHFSSVPAAIRIANKYPTITIYEKENIDNYTCIPLKNVARENNRFLIARVRESERETDALRLTIFNTLFCCFV